jgi:hypothetical protein
VTVAGVDAEHAALPARELIAGERQPGDTEPSMRRSRKQPGQLPVGAAGVRVDPLRARVPRPADDRDVGVAVEQVAGRARQSVRRRDAVDVARERDRVPGDRSDRAVEPDRHAAVPARRTRADDRAHLPDRRRRCQRRLVMTLDPTVVATSVAVVTGVTAAFWSMFVRAVNHTSQPVMSRIEFDTAR